MEKGILVNDQVGGESIATRDGFEADDSGNPRVVQRIDFASGRMPVEGLTAIRSGVTTVQDSLSFDSLAAGITDNLIPVGDKSMLVVSVAGDDLFTAPVQIVPILFDNKATPEPVLPLPVKEFSNDLGNSIWFWDQTELVYHSPAQAWDVSGAHHIGLAVAFFPDSDGTRTINIYGYVI